MRNAECGIGVRSLREGALHGLRRSAKTTPRLRAHPSLEGNWGLEHKIHRRFLLAFAQKVQC